MEISEVAHYMNNHLNIYLRENLEEYYLYDNEIMGLYNSKVIHRKMINAAKKDAEEVDISIGEQRRISIGREEEKLIYLKIKYQ